MPAKASPAADETPEGAAGKMRSRARKFLYGTGDRPLDGYTIKRGVGHGGFGEVYFATSDAGKEVALKLIRRNLDIELRGVRQCLNLKHPNLISLFDIRSDSVDDEWVVMEYVSGESLEDALQRCPAGLPIEEALAWFRGIAAGVSYLHQSGIVHRDLKPGNLFLEGSFITKPDGSLGDGMVKIGDYGLSKFISTSRRSGQTESVGTVHYMAPEIAGGRYGREIDTYALGIILYEMLTGHVPFEGESVGEVLMKHLTAEPELSRVAEPYRSIIAKALAKDPEARLKSVEEMVALLPQATSATGVSPQMGNAAKPVISDELLYGPMEYWSPVSTPPHKNYSKSKGEPLWQGLTELVENGRKAWGQWAAPPLLKGLVLFAIVATIFSTGLFAVPIALLPIYLVYYIVWSIFFDEAPDVAPTPTAVAPNGRPVVGATPVSEKPNAKRARQFGWREVARKQLKEQSPREWTRSLVGSMLIAAVVAMVSSTVLATMVLTDANEEALPLGVGLAVLGTLGAWGVLIVNRLTETRLEDHLPIRGLHLLVGLGVGVMAFVLSQVLGPEIPYSREMGIRPQGSILEEAFDIDLYQGSIKGDETITVPLKASVVYFSVLFFALRWWKSAEYTRKNRVSVWSIGFIVFGAWVLTLFAWYPQPIGMVIAGVTALAIQSSSPWLPPSKRAELARGYNQRGAVV